MKKQILILMMLFSAAICSANTILQQYEKACYLDKAKGRTKEAFTLYQEISEAEPTPENSEAIKTSLLRMLEIGTAEKHQPTIQECHEKLLTKTLLPLQELIDLLTKGSSLYIPTGIHQGALLIDKELTLIGTGTDAILTAQSDKSLIHVTKKANVTLKNLTLKSQRETSERTDPPGCTLHVKDASVTVENCRVEALGSPSQCPLGVYIEGFSEARLLNSRFAGYAYPIFFATGTSGDVKNCTISNPGDCGFMSHAESEVRLEGNIFTGSAKHGVRSTGGTIHVENNLIIGNRNRGIYLGNKTTHGNIINNAIIKNGTGISTFASSDVEIEHNVILNNGFSGIDTRYYGKILVKNNIIAGNTETGFAVFEEGSNKFKVGKNTFFNNGEPARDFKLPSSTIVEDPKFENPENGDFSVTASNVKSAEHGLTDPTIIAALWKKYEESNK